MPKGVTETGVWAFNASLAETVMENLDGTGNVPAVRVPISFNIPVSGNLAITKIKFEGDPACTGTAAVPAAAEGFLCIYQQSAVNAVIGFTSFPGSAVGRSGATIGYKITSDNAKATGSFAVTGF